MDRRFADHSMVTRFLLFAGVSFILVAILLGEVYAIFVAHIANAGIKAAWTSTVDAVTSGHTDAVRILLDEIETLTDKRGRFMNTHSHFGSFGLLTLLLGIIQHAVHLAQKPKIIAAIAVVFGMLFQCVGVFVSHYAPGWPHVLSYFGAILIVVGLAATLYGICTADRADFERLGNLLRANFDSRSSRELVIAGCFLLIIGILFGIYQAGQLIRNDEQAVYSALESAAESMSLGDVDAAKSSMASFKRQQSINAITAAAHSHALEFAMLMLMLSLIQNYIFLTTRLKVFFTRCVVLGSYALPVCVFFATKVGLKAAALADLSGAIVLLGLFGMWIGMIRHGGITDYIDTAIGGKNESRP